MIESIKFISPADIWLARYSVNDDRNQILKYLDEQNIKISDLLMFENHIRISLLARNIKYHDVIYISNKEIQELLQLTNSRDFYFTPDNQDNFEEPLSKGIVLVLTKYEVK